MAAAKSKATEAAVKSDAADRPARAAERQADEWGWNRSEVSHWWLDANRRTRLSSADNGDTWRATDRHYNWIRDDKGEIIEYPTEAGALVAAVAAGNARV